MSISLFISLFLALVCAGLVLRYWPKVERAAPKAGKGVWRALVKYRVGLGVTVALVTFSAVGVAVHREAVASFKKAETVRAYAWKRREAARYRKELGEAEFEKRCKGTVRKGGGSGMTA